MPFGGDSIAFGDRDADTSGTPDEFGHFPISTATTVALGCRHRPLTFQETKELELDIATEWWRSTVPVFEYTAEIREKVMSAKPNDVITVGGVTYQINGGVRTHPDMAGIPFKTTIISKLIIS